MSICIAFCLICLSSLSTWICIVAERPWGSSKSFVLCVLEVRELWSLRLSRKMDINFDRKIISNTNRQYLVQDFPVARVSFQTKITLQFDESQNHFCRTSLEFLLKSIVFSLKFICIAFVWHKLQQRSINIMPFAPDARGDSFKELILTFYGPKRILQSIRSIRLNFSPAIILPI